MLSIPIMFDESFNFESENFESTNVLDFSSNPIIIYPSSPNVLAIAVESFRNSLRSFLFEKSYHL